MQVIAHGGAGSSPDDPEARQAVLDEAARRGADADAPTEAALRTVRALESDPQFNAGVGSAVQSDGVVRTDAGLMTDDGAVGAACAMPGVERALDVARLVKEETPHVLVAADYGVDVECDLWTEATRERWESVEEAPPAPTEGQRAHAAWVREQFTGVDTVGAVARDRDRLAAATSTGGRWFALAGRVGDVPQVGSGFFCTRAGGASATGAGEDIARVTLARRAVDHLEYGRDAADAADLAIEEFADRTGSQAGVIVQGNDGSVGSAYNSELMQTSVAGQ